MRTHGLDLLHSFTLPGFSWHATLKYTGQELELISDREKYDFIRGYARWDQHDNHNAREGHNPYMKDEYDPNKDTEYIQYLDANNLYGWAMSHRYQLGISSGCPRRS